MPYIRFAPQADNRRASQATVPIAFENVYLEKAPQGAAKRSEWFVTSRPGRTRVATLPSNCRGLMCEPGCREGHLFAPAGSALYEVFSNYSYSDVGTLSGGDTVILRAYRDDLALEAFGQIKVYDGSSLTQVVDADAPTDAGGLAAVGLRLVSFEDGAVAFVWSKAGLPLDWPSDGEAATPDLVDPIVGVEEIGDNLWVFGKRKIRPWQATGLPADADAFSKLTTGAIARGLIGPFAITQADNGEKLFIGDNRAVFKTTGAGIAPIEYRNLELALEALSEEAAAGIKCWSYEVGSRRFGGVSAGLPEAHVLDFLTGLWSTWTRYGEDVFDIDYTANAYSQRVAASSSSALLWRLDASVYTDDGDPILRRFQIHVPSSGDVPVDRLVFDIETTGVPLSGDGAEPVCQVEYSTDNGQNWINYGDVELPHANNRFRPQIWGLGLADAVAGMLIRCTISQPFGFAAYGIFVNPTDQEITMA